MSLLGGAAPGHVHDFVCTWLERGSDLRFGDASRGTAGSWGCLRSACWTGHCGCSLSVMPPSLKSKKARWDCWGWEDNIPTLRTSKTSPTEVQESPDLAVPGSENCQLFLLSPFRVSSSSLTACLCPVSTLLLHAVTWSVPRHWVNLKQPRCWS